MDAKFTFRTYILYKVLSFFGFGFCIIYFVLLLLFARSHSDFWIVLPIVLLFCAFSVFCYWRGSFRVTLTSKDISIYNGKKMKFHQNYSEFQGCCVVKPEGTYKFFKDSNRIKCLCFYNNEKPDSNFKFSFTYYYDEANKTLFVPICKSTVNKALLFLNDTELLKKPSIG